MEKFLWRKFCSMKDCLPSWALCRCACRKIIAVTRSGAMAGWPGGGAAAASRTEACCRMSGLGNGLSYEGQIFIINLAGAVAAHIAAGQSAGYIGAGDAGSSSRQDSNMRQAFIRHGLICIDGNTAGGYGQRPLGAGGVGFWQSVSGAHRKQRLAGAAFALPGMLIYLL